MNGWEKRAVRMMSLEDDSLTGQERMAAKREMRSNVWGRRSSSAVKFSCLMRVRM